jgi:hypothetical protein
MLVEDVSWPIDHIAELEVFKHHRIGIIEHYLQISSIKLEGVYIELRHLSSAQSLSPTIKVPAPSCALMIPHGVNIEDIQLAGEW